jgi:hypothetical protein
MNGQNKKSAAVGWSKKMPKRSENGVGASLTRLVLIEVIALVAISIFSGAANGTVSGAVDGVHAQGQPQFPSTAQKEKAVTTHAAGGFEVKLAEQGEAEKGDGSTLGKYSLDKQYHGDLEGAATGTMLTAGTEVKGSAGYVAMERVTGTLKGRSGSFVLQHSATMTRGEPQLSITVVPDSGSGQLVGLTGRMNIIIAAGKHSYDFEYSLPAAQ